MQTTLPYDNTALGLMLITHLYSAVIFPILGCPEADPLLTCQLLLLHQPRCGGHKIRLVGLIWQLSDDN